jgi:outer membrane protein OmpA-like peptidoglycan-associated protein
MKSCPANRILCPGRLALLALATAVAIPAFAQQQQPLPSDSDNAPVANAQQPPAPSQVSTSNMAPKEGFWGHLNPFASKKFVRKQTAPLNDRLGELDEINAKNGRDIRDVDGRAQAGIRQAQSSADMANQTATAANTRAQNAHNTARNASGHVDQLNNTVNGLDQYKQVTEAEVMFRSGEPVLSQAARKQLDDLAASASGQKGYILEVEAHSPAAGSIGIQNSERLAEAVKRYLVTQHDIPVYRMHAVALGNARSQTDEDSKPVRVSSVHIRLMENSLAAQESVPPQGLASSTGAERP